MISRLLPFSLIVAVCAVPAASQASPQNNPVVARATNFGRLTVSGGADLLSPGPKSGLQAAGPLDRVSMDELQPRLDHFVLPRVLRLPPLEDFQTDSICYAIRSYKVARDDPQSDTTHAAGYSTCQPATRFHVDSVRGVIRPEMQ